MLIRSALGAADKRRIQAMLFANNGGDLRQQLLDGSPLNLSNLTHSLIPVRGDVTPSFTRATTETGQKWDEAGYLNFTALAGEAVFKGARRERNLLTFPEDFSNAAWTKINGGAGSAPTVTSGFTDPDGGTTAWRLQANAGGVTGSDYSVVRQSIASAITYGQRSIYIKSNTGVSQVVYFGAAESDDSVTATTEWQQLAVLDSASSVLFDIGCYRPGGVGSGAQSIDVLIWHPNLANITGETDQTTIRPYVSVGVESAPAYHGSMVDGVKCYDTDRSGNPISTSGSYPIVGYVPWEARTNLCLQSQTFPTAPWSAARVTIATDNIAAPDGTTTAERFTADAGTATSHLLAQSGGPVVSATTQTHSIYVKAGTHNYVCLNIQGTAQNFVSKVFDLSTGTVGETKLGTTSGTLNSSFITDVGNGWYRIGITGQITSGGVLYVAVFFAQAATGNTFNTTGDVQINTAGTETLYLWGAQSETGSAATSYIPTTTVAVTRNADVLTYSGGDIPNLKTLAAIGFKRDVGVTDTGYVAAVSNGAALTEYAGFYLASAGTAARFAGADGGVGQWDQAASNAYTPGTASDIAQSWATNSVRMSKDGVAQTADTTATTPSPTQLDIGNIGGSFQLNGNVGGIYGWTRNLSQSELNAVTA